MSQSARVMSGEDVSNFCRELRDGLAKAVATHGKMLGGGTSPALVSSVALMFSFDCWLKLFPPDEMASVVKELVNLYCANDHNKLMRRVLDIAGTATLRE